MIVAQCTDTQRDTNITHDSDNHYPSCLCTPCVIALPPDFLKRSCDPHPANNEKWYQLYRKFWGLLSSLGVWRDEEYLCRKATRTVRDDRRDIMPVCVIEVYIYNI